MPPHKSVFLFSVCIISSFPRKYNNKPVTMRLQTGYRFWASGYILLFFPLSIRSPQILPLIIRQVTDIISAEFIGMTYNF